MDMVESAKRAASEHVRRWGGCDGDVEMVADAIYSERKRCAEVARNTRHAEFYGNPDQMSAASFIAEAIEAGS